MSSSVAVLAYVLNTPDTTAMTRTRLTAAAEFAQGAHQAALEERWCGDDRSGLVVWEPVEHETDWPVFAQHAGAATAWIHVPAAAGSPETGIDPWTLASDVLEGRAEAAAVGSPFAVLRWGSGQLDIANDVLGLARLFHYRFPGGHVWTTRQGLAHIFMGEAPAKNEDAWASMAALGWSIAGETQLGHGTQLRGGNRVQARSMPEPRVSCDENFGAWFERVRMKPVPSVSDNVRDMELLLSTARRWPSKAIADLSGGKDSRVGASLGIRAGAVAAVRTYDSDPGEVEVARQLMASIDESVPHLVESKKPRGRSCEEDFLDRLRTQHVAFEGRFLAPTAFNSARFAGFRSAPRARLNGLGGEVLAGGNFATGRWKERLLGADTAFGADRIRAMARVSRGSSEAALARLDESLTRVFAEFETEGARTAGEALDLFYARDRMPNWSVTFATMEQICPLFAPSVLERAMHSVGAPLEVGRIHTELVRAAIPAWADVPFYTPTFSTRTAVPVWERPEWETLARYVRDNEGASESFSEEGLSHVLREIAAGGGGKVHEVAVLRFVWDTSFEEYLARVRRSASHVRAELDRQRFSAGQ